MCLGKTKPQRAATLWGFYSVKVVYAYSGTGPVESRTISGARSRIEPIGI